MTCVQRRSAHRIRGTTARGRDGRCGSPRYPLLVRARLSVTAPTIDPALDGLNDFRLWQGYVYRPLPAWVVIPWTPLREVQPASQSAGVSAVPHSQGVYGALVAPSTEMSRITIYLPQRCPE